MYLAGTVGFWVAFLVFIGTSLVATSPDSIAVQAIESGTEHLYVVMMFVMWAFAFSYLLFLHNLEGSMGKVHAIAGSLSQIAISIALAPTSFPRYPAG